MQLLSGLQESVERTREYELSADLLGKLSGAVLGSQVAHGFVDRRGKLVHFVFNGLDLTELEVEKAEEAVMDGRYVSNYIGPLSRADAAKAYTEHYIAHSSLRTELGR